MPRKILALDVNSDSISVVQVSCGLKTHQIIACGHVLIEKPGGLDEAMKSLLNEMEITSDSTIVSIPGERVSYRNLRMPFKDAKKISQTLPFEVETMLPYRIEDLIVDFTVVDKGDESEILAACASRAYISEYLRQLQAYGLDPEIIDISGVPTVHWLLKQADTPGNGLFLRIGGETNTMILHLKRRIALVRTIPSKGPPVAQILREKTNNNQPDPEVTERLEASIGCLCKEVQATLHGFRWQTRKEVQPEKVFVTGPAAMHPDTARLLGESFQLPVDIIDIGRDSHIQMDENIARLWNPALMDNALALAIRETKRGVCFNFRKGEFEVKRHYFVHKKEIQKAAAFLLIILSLLSLDMGLDYHFLKERHTSLGHQITQVFTETFPDVKRIVNPVQQMRVKISEIKKSSFLPEASANEKVLDLLKDISQRLPESVDVHVTRITVDQDAVLIKGETDTFNSVDTIKKRLETSTYFSAVTISSANVDRSGNRVRFEIKLKRSTKLKT
ncbi:MAG: pilus assembly protein PilM [Deltaproteobacteria bacterium]|nr:pilus assembly protein PilM [Deltaproteobacteria bacterium]